MAYVIYSPSGQKITTNNGIEYQAYMGMGYSTTPPKSGSSGGSSGSGSSGSGAAATNTVVSAQDKRRQEVANLTLSNVPDIAKLQKQSQEIYISTGRWDTAEQKKLTQQADAIRKGLNPMYQEGGRGFNESQYILGGGTGSTGLEDILSSLFGAGKNVAGEATSESNNGTTFLMIGLLAVLLLFGRR